MYNWLRQPPRPPQFGWLIADHYRSFRRAHDYEFVEIVVVAAAVVAGLLPTSDSQLEVNYCADGDGVGGVDAGGVGADGVDD